MYSVIFFKRDVLPGSRSRVYSYQLLFRLNAWKRYHPATRFQSLVDVKTPPGKIPRRDEEGPRSGVAREHAPLGLVEHTGTYLHAWRNAGRRAVHRKRSRQSLKTSGRTGVAREHTPLGLGEHTGTYRVIRVLPSRSGSSRPYILQHQHHVFESNSNTWPGMYGVCNCSSVWTPRPMLADEFKLVLTAAFVQGEAARS